jgi:hypothetical protein
MDKRCRHGTSWLMCGGTLEWCWGCGAVRQLCQNHRPGATDLIAVTEWQKPVGAAAENPWPMKPLKSYLASRQQYSRGYARTSKGDA